MHFGNVLTLLCLSTTALSFKIRAYESGDCSGDSKDVNVEDNTCRRDNIPDTKSFEVLAYGAGRQRAAFYESGECAGSAGGHTWNDYWADGGSDTFRKGRCVGLGFTAKAYGSRSA